jgi:hypothetical protein
MIVLRGLGLGMQCVGHVSEVVSAIDIIKELDPNVHWKSQQLILEMKA